MIYKSQLNNYEKSGSTICELSSGIFWVLVDSYDFKDYSLIVFNIPCDSKGNIESRTINNLNSKKGNNYNHQKTWDELIKYKTQFKPYSRKEYDYYPRGRVIISSDKAKIFLNPMINTFGVVNDIRFRFGLKENNISQVQIFEDRSSHYKCFLDTDKRY